MSKAYQVCRAYESQQRGANGPKNVCVFEKGLSSKGILELNGNFLEDHPIGDNYGTYNCDADDDDDDGDYDDHVHDDDDEAHPNSSGPHHASN